MKTIHRLLLAMAALAAIVCVSAGSLHAAGDAPPAAATVSEAAAALTAETAPAPSLAADTAASLTWQQSLIVVLTPLLIAGLKKIVPQIPKVWLPILAPVLGAVLEVISHFSTGADLNVWAALALGAAGVGLREGVKQIKTAVAAPAAA